MSKATLLTSEDTSDRSAVMRAVKGSDTMPELLVRRLLRAIAPGYRLHWRKAPGRPDIAWPGRRQALFVHGCFWHGHDCPRGARVPKSNTDYWLAKIERNRARDARNLATLSEAGWRTLVVWECEIKDESALTTRLITFLSRPAALPSPAPSG